MKKLFTLVLFAFAAIIVRAADYTEPIVVTVNGVSTEQKATISVNQNGDKYDLTLKNFTLASPDGPMGVGNVAITGITPVKIDEATLLQTSQSIQITPGDDPSVPFWLAATLPPVPVTLECKLENDHLRCFIYIDMMTTMGQIIQVTVGKGYQFQNAGFEYWHTSTGDYVEPNSWHSFETATGFLAGFAGHHIRKSEDAHSGSSSASLFATAVFFGIIANGTMTTGRMNAGSGSAADAANNAYLDMSKTDVDGNGDPYYTPMYSRPDSIAAWVKFKQAQPQAENPYATMSAVITDGTYYQEPEDKEYTNVVAKAKNNTIADTNGEWVRLVVPFEYTANEVEPKAVLVTLSTNATPGSGSDGDELLVDDVEFVYNARLTSLKVKGQEVPGFSSDNLSYEIEVKEPVTLEDLETVADGKAALVEKKIEAGENIQECQLIVYSGDMGKKTIYQIHVKPQSTAISNISQKVENSNIVYNLNGQRVVKAGKGIYITNGKKVLRK